MVFYFSKLCSELSLKQGSSNLQSLIPYKDWWWVLAKVAFDQTAWAALWNSIYFVVLGLLRFESPANIFGELKATFVPMLTVSNSSALTLHVYKYRNSLDFQNLIISLLLGVEVSSTELTSDLN